VPCCPEQTLSEPVPYSIAKAILRTVAYADVFDYPLTLDQVHRYLVGITASPSAVHNALHSESLTHRWLAHTDDYFCLTGREGIVQTRIRRAEIAARLWPKARRYAMSIASLPFVRMVAITGTLAVDNVDSDADIDYLIVTVPGRVWLARALSIAYVHVGRLERVEICPNYVISLDALDQFDRTFYSAHELAQMVPLYGLDVYHRLVQTNRWARAYLPNAFGSSVLGPRDQATRTRVSGARQRLKQGAEHVLQGRLGDFWERRESTLKIRQLNAEAACSMPGATSFTPQRCKGHVDDHGSQIYQEYVWRLECLGLEPEETWRQPAGPPAS
jgi:hypothetical protein